MFKVRAALPLLAGLAILAGCRDAITPTSIEPSPADLQASAAQVLKRVPPGERHLAQIATHLPGFGGIFYDENGDLAVYLTDPGAAANAVRGVVAPFLRGNRFGIIDSRVPRAEIRLLQGQYTYLQLASWREVLDPAVLGIPGVVYTDLSGQRNRLAIKVENEAVIRAVEAAVAQLPIPRAAVIVEVKEAQSMCLDCVEKQTTISPPRPTLSSTFASVPGGVRMDWRSSGSTVGNGCTVGFNAYSYAGGQRALVFVTAAHCSTDLGSYNGFYCQPTVSGNYLGFEYYDPPFRADFGNGCPIGYKCRWSDALLVRWSSTSPANALYGYIARTSRPAIWPDASGSKTLEPFKSSMPIAGDASYPIPGMVLDKMGYQTGWMRGTVIDDCVTGDPIRRNGQSYLAVCQDVVESGSAVGDSGAPVFRFDANREAAILYGVLSTGSVTFGTKISSMGNIELDLGNLDVQVQ